MSKTHDYTSRYWGHDFYTLKIEDGGQRLVCGGWGRGISAGDFIIMPNGNGTTRYAVQRIEYKMDPPDMWSADLVFAPRTEEEKGEAS